MKNLFKICFIFCVSLLASTSGVNAQSEAKFDPDTLFPSWETASENKTGRAPVTGIIGINSIDPEGDDEASSSEGQLILYFIPKAIDFLLYLVAPIIMVFLIYSGFLLITAGDDDESVTKAKDYIKHALIGLVIILISYSIIKAVYLVLMSNV